MIRNISTLENISISFHDKDRSKPRRPTKEESFFADWIDCNLAVLNTYYERFDFKREDGLRAVPDYVFSPEEQDRATGLPVFPLAAVELTSSPRPDRPKKDKKKHVRKVASVIPHAIIYNAQTPDFCDHFTQEISGQSKKEPYVVWGALLRTIEWWREQEENLFCK
jgi:hypothetical protein